jgi:DNA-binding LytR/AlgR family response regulator
MKVVIIEDEILTAEELRHDLTLLNSGIEVTAILPTVTQSIEYFSTNVDFNLIFSDYNWAMGIHSKYLKKYQ